MSRIAPLAMEDLPAEARQAVEAASAVLGFTPADTLVMARRPALLHALMQLVQATWGPGKVDDGLKRLVAEVASNAAGCMYCTAHCAQAAALTGVSAEKIEAVWDFERNDLFDEAERAALDFARAAAQSPVHTTDAHFAELRRFYDEDQILELLGVVACMGFLNRWNDNLATGLEDVPLAFARRHLAGSGWEAGKHG